MANGFTLAPKSTAAVSARSLYLDLLAKACNYETPFASADKGRTSFASDQTISFDTSFTFNLLAAGFTEVKWESILYSYLDPRSFAQFHRQCARARLHKEIGYTCPYFGDHSTGNCIIGMTYNGERLSVFSRVALWAPTGPFDLSLLTLVAKMIGASTIVWKIGVIKLTEKSLPGLEVMNLHRDSPFVRQGVPAPTGWGARRAERTARLGSDNLDGPLPDITDYLRIIEDDPTLGEITPDHLASLKPGLKGVTVRNFLRDDLFLKKWGYSQAYRWKNYDHPIVAMIIDKFGLKV